MNEENEISLFDLLLVVADNLKLLILGPLLVGLLALGIGYALPQSFTSQAHLKLEDSAKAVQAMMRSPAVLDVVLKQFPSPLGVTDRARDRTNWPRKFGLVLHQAVKKWVLASSSWRWRMKARRVPMTWRMP